MPLLLWLSSIALKIASTVAAAVPSLRRKLQLRQQWREHLHQLPELLTSALGVPRLWVHVASAGEFEHVRSVIAQLRETFPQLFVVVSFFSPSGFAAHQRTPLADAVILLPPDTPANARRFITLVRPHVAVFIRYELWPNYLWRLRQERIPTLLIAATFPRNRLWRLPGARSILCRILSQFHAIVPLTPDDAEQFRQLLPKVSFPVVPDPRYDRIWEAAQCRPSLPLPEVFLSAERFHIIAGSTWDADHQLLFRALQQLPEEIKSRSTLILVPHEPTANTIQSLLSLFPHALCWSSMTADVPANGEFPVLIIDRLGLLLSLYGYGTVAYVGGGFGRCVHNLAEPAAYGLPLSCGPAIDGSPDAPKLIAAGALTIVHTADELAHWLSNMALHPAERRRRGAAACSVIQEHLGGTERIVALLSPYLTEALSSEA